MSLKDAAELHRPKTRNPARPYDLKRPPPFGDR
jgi:hypothetical protein